MLRFLFGGYIIPRPEIPGWWIWVSLRASSAWLVAGLLTAIALCMQHCLYSSDDLCMPAVLLDQPLGIHGTPLDQL